jgi:hypothetical protein
MRNSTKGITIKAFFPEDKGSGLHSLQIRIFFVLVNFIFTFFININSL